MRYWKQITDPLRLTELALSDDYVGTSITIYTRDWPEGFTIIGDDGKYYEWITTRYPLVKGLN